MPKTTKTAANLAPISASIITGAQPGGDRFWCRVGNDVARNFLTQAEAQAWGEWAATNPS